MNDKTESQVMKPSRPVIWKVLIFSILAVILIVIILTILLVFKSSSPGSPSKSPAGSSSNLNDTLCGCKALSDDKKTLISRAINGKEVNSGDLPWVAAISISHLDRSNASINRTYDICTGTILNSKLILTSASCIDKMQKFQQVFSNYSLITFIRAGQAIRHVHKMHSNNLNSTKADVGLIEVLEPFDFDNILPACLLIYGDGNDSFGNETLISAGYGSTEEIFKFGLSKMYLSRLTLIDSCAGEKDKICADNTHGYFCTADIGSPLMIQKDQKLFVIGVLNINYSWELTNSRCLLNSTSSFTSTHYYLKWITKMLNDELCYLT